MSDVTMPHSLRDHQAIDAVCGQIFHVTIEQARSTPAKNSLAITNHGAHSGTRAGDSSLADSRRQGTKLGLRIVALRSSMQLIRSGELLDGNFVLVGMPSPGTIHQGHC